MKLEGLIQGKRVLILIDSGASHNFISQELVQQLGLKVTPTQTYGVRLGDGNKKNAQGCCEQMEVQLGQMTITEKFFLFDLGGIDIIFGGSWWFPRLLLKKERRWVKLGLRWMRIWPSPN